MRNAVGWCVLPAACRRAVRGIQNRPSSRGYGCSVCFRTETTNGPTAREAWCPSCVQPHRTGAACSKWPQSMRGQTPLAYDEQRTMQVYRGVNASSLNGDVSIGDNRGSLIAMKSNPIAL